jgi:hypothetical protein
MAEIDSAMMLIKEKSPNDDIVNQIDELIFEVLRLSIDEETEEGMERIQKIYSKFINYTQDTPRARYDIMLMRDFALLERIRRNWKRANNDYFASEQAWGISNDRLSDIQRELIMIANRWDLRIVPKEEPFNIMQMPNIINPMTRHPLER